MGPRRAPQNQNNATIFASLLAVGPPARKPNAFETSLARGVERACSLRVLSKTLRSRTRPTAQVVVLCGIASVQSTQTSSAFSHREGMGWAAGDSDGEGTAPAGEVIAPPDGLWEALKTAASSCAVPKRRLRAAWGGRVPEHVSDILANFESEP